MWWSLHKCEWHLDFTIVPKSIPTPGGLHIHNISTWGHLYHLVCHQHGHKLPCCWIWQHWVEGWQFYNITFDGEMVRQWQQCTRRSANHSKPPKNQVNLNFFEVLNNYTFGSQIQVKLLWEWIWVPIEIWGNQCGSANDLQNRRMRRQFYNHKWYHDITIIPRELPTEHGVFLHNLCSWWKYHNSELPSHGHTQVV